MKSTKKGLLSSYSVAPQLADIVESFGALLPRGSHLTRVLATIAGDRPVLKARVQMPHDALNDREQMWRLKMPPATHISLVQPNVFGLLHVKEKFYDTNQALVSRIDRRRYAGNARHGSRKLRSQAARH
jgi:hypothetical protein